jgi:hypothetical protein
MKFIELRVKIQHSQEPARRVHTSDFCLEILFVRVATINELGNHEIFKQSILKFDILINSHIVYSNIWSPYLVKVRISVAILSHISGNEPEIDASVTHDSTVAVCICSHVTNFQSDAHGTPHPTSNRTPTVTLTWGEGQEHYLS